MSESAVSEASSICTNNQVNINTEHDLHKRIIAWVRRFYPQLIVIPGLGELQTTDGARIQAWQKGYVRGTCDIMILNNHKEHRGLCIELKTPKGSGKLSEAQEQFLQRMRANKFLVIVSNDYDEITYEIGKYATKVIKANSKRGRKRKGTTVV
jgi:hypothetical protein